MQLQPNATTCHRRRRGDHPAPRSRPTCSSSLAAWHVATSAGDAAAAKSTTKASASALLEESESTSFPSLRGLHTKAHASCCRIFSPPFRRRRGGFGAKERRRNYFRTIYLRMWQIFEDLRWIFGAKAGGRGQ